ncbi:MAG: hypothetical protein ACE19O_00050 [Candidatus Karelsulcia muelleri]
MLKTHYSKMSRTPYEGRLLSLISKYINIYNKKLYQDLRIENIIIPIRDGLSLSFVKI